MQIIKLQILWKSAYTLCKDCRVFPTEDDATDVEPAVRDMDDRPILRAALKADADILITGDSGITKPCIVTPAQFLDMFC